MPILYQPAIRLTVSPVPAIFGRPPRIFGSRSIKVPISVTDAITIAYRAVFLHNAAPTAQPQPFTISGSESWVVRLHIRSAVRLGNGPRRRGCVGGDRSRVVTEVERASASPLYVCIVGHAAGSVGGHVDGERDERVTAARE